MPLRPLLFSLLLSAAGGAAYAQPADDSGLAGGPPPPGRERMAPPAGHMGHGHCFAARGSTEVDPRTGEPGDFRWRRIPCRPHAMDDRGPPPPPPGDERADADRAMPPPPQGPDVREHRYYSEHREYRDYDSDRDGYPPPEWARRAAPDFDYPMAPPPGYAGPPPGYDAPPSDYDGPSEGYDGPPPDYDGPPPDYDGPPPGYDGPPPQGPDDQGGDGQRYLDWPDKNY